MVKFSKFPNKTEAQERYRQAGKSGAYRSCHLPMWLKTVHKALRPTKAAPMTGPQKAASDDAEIDQAIFGLPVGQLSRIIETERGYHIVRVTERTETRSHALSNRPSENKRKNQGRTHQ